MPIEWSAITAAHVQQACESVTARQQTPDRNTGLVVYCGERRLPAKEILREAYRLAKGLAPEAEINFASGEATLNVLRKLGFRAERLSSRTTSAPQS
jgi:hypothetical protein